MQAYTVLGTILFTKKEIKIKICLTVNKMLFELHLQYYTLWLLQKYCKFEFECDFGSKIKHYLSLGFKVLD